MTWGTAAAFCINSLRSPEYPESMKPEKAIAVLRRMSGLDYGDDADAWEAWAEASGNLRLMGRDEEHRDS